jgi:hypothetical protein
MSNRGMAALHLDTISLSAYPRRCLSIAERAGACAASMAARVAVRSIRVGATLADAKSWIGGDRQRARRGRLALAEVVALSR